MTKTISTVAIFIAFTVSAQSEVFKNNYLGVSKEYTQIENQVEKKCSQYDSNFKKFEKCRKQVAKSVRKRLKKGGKK